MEDSWELSVGKNDILSRSLCAHGVVSERFHNNENENDINCKNPSHRAKFSVFIQRRALAGFVTT